MFKWVFRLTLSFYKSHCLDAGAATKHCMCAVCQQKTTCARLPSSLGAGQSCAACRQALLIQAAQMTACRAEAVHIAAGLGAGGRLSSVSNGWSLAEPYFFSFHCRKDHLNTILFNQGGLSCSKASLNTVTIQGRNTSMVQCAK